MIPAILIGGTGSGVGKTSLSIGIVGALRRRGLTIATYKVGPDFLDPTWLSMASERPCYNLDSWMTSPEYVKEIFERTTIGCDIAIIEGVMGLFDGASATSNVGSSAEISSLLGVPVVLAVDVSGAARSVAAMVHGFASFEEPSQPTIAGIIANYCGSAGHAKLVTEALESKNLPPLVGYLEKKQLPSLPDRHLGLYAAHARHDSQELIFRLASAVEETLNLDRILSLANTRVGPSESSVHSTVEKKNRLDASGEAENVFSLNVFQPTQSIHNDKDHRPRIGIARDSAFHFYYPDNLQFLRDAGAELIEFSPMHDLELPPELDAIYLGGGYPEENAYELSSNREMIQQMRAFANIGKSIYAECGGMMYLAESIQTLDGKKHSMCGLLPFATRMLSKRKMLGYVEATLQSECILGLKGDVIRGHEFHYSEIVDQNSAVIDLWRKIYALSGRRTSAIREEGYGNESGTILASYVHLHFGSNPNSAMNFVEHLKKTGSKSIRSKEGLRKESTLMIKRGEA